MSLVSLEAKVKVMLISTANIAKMVTDRENIAIAIKYDVTCRLAIYMPIL